MRHILLALMIALLPLRGWVGDVMATEMLASKVAHAQVDDCATAHGAAEGATQADANCSSCTVCQACHTLALSPVTTNLGALVLAPVLAYAPAAHFASAPLALSQKPPIS